jgi:hypothetical protein
MGLGSWWKLKRMQERARTYIFHIFRADGKSLVLHPFRTPEKLTAALEQTEVTGRYGGDPHVDELHRLRAELYGLIDSAVKRRLADVRFIPKFLISSAVFLVSYFFFSFVVQDPVPMVDELVISIALAVLAYIILGRRDARSEGAAHRRLGLVAVIDGILFTESEFVKRAEATLHVNESRGIGEMLREIITPSLQELGEEEREEAVQFLALLEGRFDSRRLKREERLLKRLAATPEALPAGEKLASRVKPRDFDFPLYAVYKSLKRSVMDRKS